MLLPLLLLVAGCNLNLPSWRGAWREVQELPGMGEAQFALTGSGFDSRPEAPASEVASLKLQMAGRRAHARLLQETGERRLWRTPGGLVLATEGARVVATAGLAHSIAASRFETPDPLLEPRTLLARNASVRRQVDLMTQAREPGGMRFGVLLNCRLRARPLPEDAATLLVEEYCEGEALAGFTNLFWLEAASGAVLRSEQWIGPNLPPLRIEEISPGG